MSGGGAGTYVSRNVGMAMTEFSYLAQRADTDCVLFAGEQDSGTLRLLGEQLAGKWLAATAAGRRTIQQFVPNDAPVC